MHCRGQICLELATECICLCSTCARAKAADGQPICPICHRTHFGIEAGGYTHPDGSVCMVTD